MLLTALTALTGTSALTALTALTVLTALTALTGTSVVTPSAAVGGPYDVTLWVVALRARDEGILVLLPNHA